MKSIDFGYREDYDKKGVPESGGMYAISDAHASELRRKLMINMEENDYRIPKLILFLGVFSASLSSAFVKSMTAPSSVAATYRLGLTVLLMTPVVLMKPDHRKELCALKPRDVMFCAMSGFFFAFHLYVWFESLKYTSVSSSTVLVNTEVIFAALGYILFFGKRLKKGEWIAIGVALLGSVIIATADGGGEGGALQGDILAAAAAAFTAIYTLIGTRERDHISTTVYTYILYSGSFLTLLAVDLVTGTPLLGYEPIDWIMALCMAVFCTLLGHSVFSWSLKYLTPTYVSTVKLAGPVFASVTAVFLFHEIPGVMQVFGALVVLFGVYLYARQK